MHSIQYCKNSSIILQRFLVTRHIIIWLTVLLHLLETHSRSAVMHCAWLSDALFFHTTEYGEKRLKSAWVFHVSAGVETIAERWTLEREDSYNCMLNAFIKHMHADVQKHTHTHTSAWPLRFCPAQGRVISERKQQMTHTRALIHNLQTPKRKKTH